MSIYVNILYLIYAYLCMYLFLFLYHRKQNIKKYQSRLNRNNTWLHCSVCCTIECSQIPDTNYKWYIVL